MWVKEGNSSGNLPCLGPGYPHRNQVASETMYETTSAIERVSCDVCLEENKVCKCSNSSGNLKSLNELSTDEPQENANSSFTHAVINMVGMLIGLGQLSTPYALQTGGWASGFLLIGLGIICTYSAHLLGKCLDKNPKSRSYTDIGQHAFGTKGKIIAATFIYVEIFMALVSYTISLHDNLSKVFTGTTLKVPLIELSQSRLLTVIAVLVTLPSLWLRDLSSISFLSTAGIVMSIVIFMTVASTGILGGVKANATIPVLQLHKIPSISGLYVFSFAGHIVFPNIYKAMKDPSKFSKVAIVSFTIVTSLYTGLAFMGAKLYGPGVSPQITLSMPQHLLVTKIALWASVLTPMTKYALEFAPFAIQLENILPPSVTPRNRMIIRGSVGSILLLAILALALSMPYFRYILSLTGSLVSVTICIILPCIFYTKIFKGDLSKSRLILNMVLITLGSILGVLGIISSSKLLIEALSSAINRQSRA